MLRPDPLHNHCIWHILPIGEGLPIHLHCFLAAPYALRPFRQRGKMRKTGTYQRALGTPAGRSASAPVSPNVRAVALERHLSFRQNRFVGRLSAERAWPRRLRREASSRDPSTANTRQPCQSRPSNRRTSAERSVSCASGPRRPRQIVDGVACQPLGRRCRWPLKCTSRQDESKPRRTGAWGTSAGLGTLPGTANPSKTLAQSLYWRQSDWRRGGRCGTAPDYDSTQGGMP